MKIIQINEIYRIKNLQDIADDMKGCLIKIVEYHDDERFVGEILSGPNQCIRVKISPRWLELIDKN